MPSGPISGTMAAKRTPPLQASMAALPFTSAAESSIPACRMPAVARTRPPVAGPPASIFGTSAANSRATFALPRTGRSPAGNFPPPLQDTTSSLSTCSSPPTSPAARRPSPAGSGGIRDDGRAAAGQHGLGEPGAHVALPPLPGRPQEGQAEVGDRGGEPGGGLGDGRAVRRGPAQEGVQQCVLGVTRRPEQPVGKTNRRLRSGSKVMAASPVP